MMDMKEQLQMIKSVMVNSEVSTIENKDMNNNNVKVESVNNNKTNYKESKNINTTNYKQPIIKDIKRGDILYTELSGGIGSEQNNDRYCICIQNDVANRYSPTIIVAFITSRLTKAKLPVHLEVSAGNYGLPKDSVIMFEQLRTLDKRRIISKVGHMDELTLKRADMALDISIKTLKPKTTFERLTSEKQQYILDKLNIIKECEVVLKFFHRLNKDANAIELAEDEKFEAENALMSFCYNNGLNCDEFYTQENGVNSELIAL